MKYKLFVLTGIVFLFISCVRQDKKKQVRPKENQLTESSMQISTIPLRADTTRAIELIDEAFRISKYPDSAIVYIDEALKLSHRIKLISGTAAGLYLKGLYFLEKADYKTADSFFQKTLYYCNLTETEDERLLPWTYQRLAQIYGNQGEYDSATYFYHKALITTKKKQKG